MATPGTSRTKPLDATAVQTLAATLRGPLVQPGEPGYDAARTVWNALIDRHPSCPEVVIASPCSGHGFKFSPVIGEIAANLLEEKDPGFDLSLFNIKRFLS